MRGRPALHPDVAARIELHALSGNLADALRRAAMLRARRRAVNRPPAGFDPRRPLT
jgi:hypothetical protein